MNFKTYYNDHLDRLVIEQKCKDLPSVQKAVSIFPKDIIFWPDDKPLPDEWLNQRTVFVTDSRGERVGHCPGSKTRACCNYITVDVYLGCSIACSYCIMKSYLNFSPLTVYADPLPAIKTICGIAEKNPDVLVRVGSGEVGDSLLLDPLFHLSNEFIEAFAGYPNVSFESKTKTSYVGHLLDIKNKGNAVIAFSLNPQSMIDSEEPFASPLAQRIAAALQAVDAGYKVAFHFDPIYKKAVDSGEYDELIRNHLLQFRRRDIAWISMGTIRYTSGLRDKMALRPYLEDEFVCAADGKFRYVQKERIRLYKRICANFEPMPSAPIYFCMENEAVWQAVFGCKSSDSLNAGFLYRDIDGVKEHMRLKS